MKTKAQNSNWAADLGHCFRYIDCTIPLLPKSEISSLEPSVAVQPGICRTCWETLNTGFLATGLICHVLLLLGEGEITDIAMELKRMAGTHQ